MLFCGIEESISNFIQNAPISSAVPATICHCMLYFTQFIRKYSGTEDPFFKEALMRLNPWVDEDDRQVRDMASNVSPGERLDQSEASSVFMGQVRDAMAISMWNLSNGM
jgi:hypothetical protein